MLKVMYSEIVKSNLPDRMFPERGLVVERSRTFNTLSEAVQFSKYIANTTHVVGKPLIKDLD